MKRTVAVALIALSGIAAPLGAQWSTTPAVGAMLYDGSLQLRDNGRVVGSGLYEDGAVPVFGARVAYALTDTWEIEVGYDQSWLSNYEGGLTSHFYRAGLTRVQPLSPVLHAALGLFAGGVSFRPEDAGTMSDLIAGASFGLRYRVMERASIYSDLRFTGQLCDDAPAMTGLACNDGSQLGYSQMSLGLRFDL